MNTLFIIVLAIMLITGDKAWRKLKEDKQREEMKKQTESESRRQ